MKTRRVNNSFFFLVLVSVVFFGVFAVKSGGQIFKEEVGTAELANSVNDLSGNFDPGGGTGYYEGKNVDVPVAALNSDESVLGESSEEKWIEVDLSEQKLKAWEGDNLFLETSVSTGLPGTPTPQGEFRIWTKLRFTKMEGGEGKHYYNLPNVPYVMFFGGSGVPDWKGYGLHGTYWHSDFGNRRSHGCVNLPTVIAEKLYYWTSPNLSEGKNTVRATDENPGTRIAIHE